MLKPVWINFLLIFSFLFAYEQSIGQQQCNCIANLDTTIQKTQQNYAGYPDMIRRGMHPHYKKLVTKLRANAMRVSDPQKCFDILKEYVIFFNDKHFDLEYSVTDSTKYQYSTMTEDSFVRNFDEKERDPIEGLWINPDSSMKIALYKKDAETYEGIVLESKDTKLKPGLVYYTFSKTANGLVFDRYNWRTPDFPVRQRGNLLYIWNFEVWAKAFPETTTDYENDLFSTWRHYNYGLDCKKLDENNVLLSIGSFNRDDKIKEIIQKNDSLIRSAKHLIVDLRGNGGGNTGWVYLLPYFATKPIDQGRTYFRLSPDNIRATLPELKATYENAMIDPRWKKSYSPDVLEEFRKAYKEIPLSNEPFYAMPSLTLYPDSILAMPEKVALIFDDLGGSSTEFFFYVSQQSHKVKRYGERTLGMMDYMGVSQQTRLPFENYYLLIPDRKAVWTDKVPTNTTGFVPEHSLLNVPRERWIDFIKNDLEKNH